MQYEWALPSRAAELEWLGSVTPADDAGSHTPQLFDWQAGQAAVDGLRLLFAALNEDGSLIPGREYGVLCEWHEDWVKLGDQLMELVSCKHRNPKKSAYTTATTLAYDAGGAHLFASWHALGEKATCRVVTNGALALDKPLQIAWDRLRAVRTPGQRNQVILEERAIIDSMREVIATYSRSTARRWRGHEDQPGISEDEQLAEVARFLSVLTFHRAEESYEVLDDAAPRRYVAPVLERMGYGTQHVDDVWGAVLDLFRRGMQSRGRTPEGDLVIRERGYDAQYQMRRRLVTVQDLYQTIITVLSRTKATPGRIRFKVTPVRACRPRLLGVRAAIQAEGSEGEVPPYASRDVDASVRAAFRRGANAGGFVLLLGEAAVGKTRTLYEALSAELPEWFLLHPDNAAHLRAFAEEPRPNTVVWMDDLVGYLNQPEGLTAGTVRGLISAGLVIAGTMWPDDYGPLTAGGIHAGTGLSAEAAEILALADTFTVATDLSPAEYDRVKELAAVDGRWQAALASSNASPIQTLAAGPALVVRWESAPPYMKALINFAVDARRMGVASPLTEATIKDGLTGYLTQRQVADASPDWWREALSYATQVLHGATSALVPVGDGTMGTVVGYEAEDFLLQHGRRTRREVCPPTSFWDALIKNIRDPGDVQRLAYSAAVRWRFCYAEPLYRSLAANGDHRAARWVGERFCAQDRMTEAIQVLEEHVDDAPAKALLLRLLAEQGRVDVLAVEADGGDMLANGLLVALLFDRGDRENLTARAANGDRLAAAALTESSEEDIDGRDSLSQAPHVTHRLDDDEPSEKGPLTNARVRQFTRRLVKSGHVDDAIALLEACAAAAVYSVHDLLADLLAEHGRIDQLRALAQTGEWEANLKLGEVLAARGKVQEAIAVLAPLALLGVTRAANQLETLTAVYSWGDESEEGIKDDLQPWSELSEEDFQFGDDPEVEEEIDASERAKAMDAAGRTEDALALLRPYTYGYCGLAVCTLIELLAAHSRVEDLRREVDAGADGAAEHWVNLEVARGRLSEARAAGLRAFGFMADGTPLGGQSMT